MLFIGNQIFTGGIMMKSGGKNWFQCGMLLIVILLIVNGCGVGKESNSIGLKEYSSALHSTTPDFNVQPTSLHTAALDWANFQTAVIRKVFGDQEITAIPRGVALMDTVITSINNHVTLEDGVVNGAEPSPDIDLAYFGLGTVDVDYKLTVTDIVDGSVTIASADVWFKKGTTDQTIVIYIPDRVVAGVASSRFIIYGHQSGNSISIKHARYSRLVNNDNYLGSGRYEFDGNTDTHIFDYKLIWDEPTGDLTHPWVFSTIGQGVAEGAGSFGLRFTKWENSVMAVDQYFVCNPSDLSNPTASGDLMDTDTLPVEYSTSLDASNRFDSSSLPQQLSDVTLD